MSTGEAYGVATVLREGGPRAYGSLLAAGCLDDESLTPRRDRCHSGPPAPEPRRGCRIPPGTIRFPAC